MILWLSRSLLKYSELCYLFCIDRSSYIILANGFKCTLGCSDYVTKSTTITTPSAAPPPPPSPQHPLLKTSSCSYAWMLCLLNASYPLFKNAILYTKYYRPTNNRLQKIQWDMRNKNVHIHIENCTVVSVSYNINESNLV